MPSRALSHLPFLGRLAARRWRLPLLVGPPAIALAVLVAVLLYPAQSKADGAVPPAAADPNANQEAEVPAALPPPAGLLVEVTGAVAQPGMYRLAKGERVSAAIGAAGGIAPDADPDRLPDMAARLRDGQQVRVPRLRAPAGTGSGAARSAPVNLNAATEDELASVPGFTVEMAAAAVRYRSQFGGFSSTRELVDVLNMSEADYLVARSHLRV